MTDPGGSEAKLLLAKGARGELVRRAQLALSKAGFDPGPIDGDYGNGTAGAVGKFRQKNGLGTLGEVDVPTWKALTGAPTPSVRERALQLTAAFEGHGFGLVAGNYDDAYVTWGIIGFTLRHGELSTIVLEAHRRDPRLVSDAFGKQADELIAVMSAPKARQLAWGNAISILPRKVKVKEPWLASFRRFGESPDVQAIQLERVEARFVSAEALAKELGLSTELGVALCFDIVVQNGSVVPSARQQIERDVAANPIHKERELRVVIANAVADASRAPYREDVRSRKLTIATGAGKVHGATYLVRNWGLDASPLGAHEEAPGEPAPPAEPPPEVVPGTRRQLVLKSDYLEGEDIKDVQRALGLTGKAVDGFYGPETAAAVEEWKWRVGYPKNQINNRLGLVGLAWLFGEQSLPPHFARNAKAREGKPFGFENGLIRPLATSPGTRSEFSMVDAEGAPERSGVKHHAGKDWFAPGRTPVRAPCAGTIVEAKVRPTTKGQVFGGVVKIESSADKKVWVFRHCDPFNVREGGKVQAGQVVANVTPWEDGAPHAHIELWKSRSANYQYEQMEDPMTYLKIFK